MSASWDEVKQLAADFQRTQLTDSVQRLNERNCVEIVRKIIELDLLQVLFTTDGKEYLTPAHLLTELEAELHANNGRAYLTQLAAALQVDPSLVEQKATELAKQSAGQISLVLGQLISAEFKDQLATELNQRLQTKGTMSIAEMVKLYDFPPDFLQSLIQSRLRTIIQAQQDPNDPQTYSTEAYLAQYRAKIQGVLHAITKPTALSQLIANYKFPARIFQQVVSELVKDGRVKGSVGSGAGSVFVPEIYARSQQEWLQSFLSQNSYVDFDSLQRIGVADPRTFFKKHEQLVLLRTCALSRIVFEQIESAVEEAEAEAAWVDILTLAPPVLTEKDVSLLYEMLVEKNRSLSTSTSLMGSVVVSRKFVQSLLPLFEKELTANALSDLASGSFQTYLTERQQSKNSRGSGKEQQLSKKEERKRQTVGKQKSGGGQQGREVKMKSVKKKYNRRDDGSDEEDQQTGCQQNQQQSDDSSVQLSFLTKEQIAKLLLEKNKGLTDAPEELLEQLSEMLLEPLGERFLEVANSQFTASQAQGSGTAKKSHAELQQQTSSLYMNIQMFERGCQACTVGDLRVQLEKYLLRSLCTEFASGLIGWASVDPSPNLSTFESRQKCVKKLPGEFVDSFSRLNSAVNGAQMDEFYTCAEEAAEKLDLMLKKLDRKREKQMLLEARAGLLAQLAQTSDKDCALVLHLSALALFGAVNQQMLHASGKFVPQILAELKPKLPDEVYPLLSSCEQLVVRQFRKDHTAEEQEEIAKQLAEVVPQVKLIAKQVEKAK